MLPISTEAPEIGDTRRMAEVRRRIRGGYYGRPEVRRILSRMILLRLARENTGRKPGRPESA